VNDPGFPILTSLIVLPAVGTLVVALVPRTREALARQVGVAFAAATGVLSIYVVVDFELSESGFQFVSRHQWIEGFGIDWQLGVDGISLFLVLLTGLLFPLALVGVKPHHDP
jgi:NADH-quinone oxidoreductase subunit M